MTCSNDAGSTSRSAQIEVQPILMTSVNSSVSFTPAAVPLNVTFDLTLTDAYTFPDAVLMTCEFDHARSETHEHDEVTSLALTSAGFTFTHTYLHDSTSGYVITDVNCANNVSNVTFTFNVTLREAIVTSAFASVQPAFERGTPAYFHVDVTSGSHVTSVVDFGDGETLHFDPDLESGLDRVSWLVEHVYTDIGNYTVTLRRLYNEIYSNETQLSTDIIIQNALISLRFASETNLTTFDDAPANMTFFLQPGPSQLEVSDLHCSFSVADGPESWFIFFDSIPAVFGSGGVVPQFVREADAQINVTATCSNMITHSYVIQTSFALVLNDINVESLSSPNSPDWWRNRTQVLIVFSPLYSAADVTVSMGDGHDCVFDTSMATHSDAAGCDITLTTYNENMTILLTYEYEYWGQYNISLSAANSIPAYDINNLSLPIAVLEWTCLPPALQLPQNMTSQPYRIIEKTNSEFVRLDSLHLRCMKSSVVSYQWSLLNTSLFNLSGSVLPALTLTEPHLLLPVRMSLEYGVYVARVRVTMEIDEFVFGPGDVIFAEVEGSFSYVRSQLIAQLEGRGELDQECLKLFWEIF